MRLFSEEVDYTSSSSPLNILQVENFEEIFFGVYEVEINGKKYAAERVSDKDGNPVVSVIVEHNKQSSEYPFLLLKGKQEIFFNENSESTALLESSNDSYEDEEEIVEFINESTPIEIDEVFDTKKQRVIEEITKIKKDATEKSLKILEKNKLKKIQAIRNESIKKKKSLEKFLESSRQSLVDEFIRISKNIKDEITNNNDYRFDEIKEGIDLKIQDIANELNESLKNDLRDSSNLMNKSIKQLVKELYDKNVNVRLNEKLNEITLDVSKQISVINQNLDKKLDTKVEKSLLENINKEIDAIRDSNIVLNDTIKKGVQKALSRVGNIDKKIIDISESLNTKIAETENEITGYFNEKINLIKEETLDITDDARKYFQNLIQESRDNLLTEIRRLKNEKPVEYVIESKNNEKIVKDWDTIEKEWNKKIHDKFENYKTDLRKYVAVYASGGGTNATQYQDGGTMFGNLTVTGTISASQYLGVPSDYLPLSGGTVTGDVSISGLLSANRIQMNTTAGLPASEGQLTWNDQDGTLNIGLKGGNVTLQVGQEQVARVVNKTGANLFESEYRAIRIRSTAEGGTQGQRLAVVLARANNDPNSVDTLGLVTEDIAVNQEGYVTTSGLVRNINTTGTLQGETWSDGDVLYLSPFTAGRLTNIKPQAPNHTVIMGFVVYKHQNQGTIYVKVDNGYEIDELHNVKINNLSGGDVLTYDSTQSVWKNTNTLKINSLSAERIFTTHLDALSANITVVDIKQYELSGFNVTGDVTINGSVSAQNISAGNIFSNGNRVATVVDPVRTTLTGNGTLSTFPISGASGLVNPSALIVAIDGILQEPSVDYTVASGNITFTSPLPNGSKAVVISPTNTLQVSNMIPSDGSVTSSKIVGGVSISEPIITNGVFNYNTSAADAHRTALNLTSVSTTSPEALQSRVYSNSLLPYPTISFFDDCDARYSYETSGGGTAFYSDNTSIYIHGAIRVASTTTLNNRTSAVRRITGGIKGPGTVYQTVFAIENIADIEMFTGFTWVGLDSNAFGLAYRSGLDGGLFTFRQGFTYIPIPNSTAAPQSGNFQSGPRYKFTMIQNTTTESRVIIEEALSNSATWTVLHDGLVTHSARATQANVGMNPSTIVTTKTNGQRAVWVDYFMFRNDTYVR